MEGNHHAHVTRVAPWVTICGHLSTEANEPWLSGEPAGAQDSAGSRIPSSFYTTASIPGSHLSPRKKEGQENGDLGRLQQPAP